MMFRSGVRAELAADTSIEVVGEASDVEEAVRVVHEQRPDVVLLDVHLPGGLHRPGGREVLERSVDLLSQPTPVRFLALSVSDAAEDVIAVIRSGARGYVTKTISGSDLAGAIHRVADGDAVCSPRLAGFVLDAFGTGAGEVATVDEELDRLSAREREVMRLIARGYSYSSPAATPIRRSPRSSSSRSRPSRPTCPRCCASSNCRAATSSPAGPPTAACSDAERTLHLMAFLYELVVAIHLLGMAAIVGAFFVVLRSPRFVPAFLYGAITQLVSGLVLVGMRESGVVPGEEPLNRAKIGVKLAIALVVAVLAWLQRD